MSIQYYMNYVIFFSNSTEYQQALSQSGGTGLLLMAPRQAASTFGIPFPYPTGSLLGITKGIYFISPFFPGQPFNYPNPSGQFVDDTVLNTTVVAQNGNPASIWPANSPANDGIFTWSGNIILNNGAGAALNPPVTPIPQRRWITGREFSNNVEFVTAAGATPSSQSRDCSRTIDGLGYTMRAGVNFGTMLHNTNELRVPTNARTSWERFYFRLRALPTLGLFGIWRTMGTGGTAVGIGIYADTSGNLHACDSGGTDKGVLLQATAGGPKPQFEFRKWFRLDAFLRYNDSPTSSFGRIFINGVDFGFFTHIGGFSTTHGQSIIGRWNDPGSDNTFELDIDDWVNMELPGNIDQNSLAILNNNFPLDWSLGSHVLPLNALVNAGTTQVGWSPSFSVPGLENQMIPVINHLTPNLTSSTASARVDGVTDAPTQNSPQNFSTYIGAVAAQVGLYSKNAGPTNGKLGYKLAGGADVLSNITQLTTDAGQIVPYFPSGMLTPAEIAPFSIVHTKSADANLETMYAMGAIVEYLGIFGVEDDPTWTFPDIRINFTHNNRYPSSCFGYVGSQPFAPVYAIGFTFGGNSAYQEFTVPAPIHWLHIRETGGAGSLGLKYTAGMIGARLGGGQAIPNFRTWYDIPSGGTYKFSLFGDNVEFNQTGKTYQAIIFCDPGMRFNLSGTFSHNSRLGVFVTNNLCVSDFTAISAFLGVDSVDAFGTSVNAFKGPGFTGNNGAIFGSVDANIGAFGTGSFTSGQSLNGVGGGMNSWYSLWRMLDSGASGCTNNVMVQLLSYTGNGAGGTRVITVTPASGRFPLFVLVVPNAAASAFFRDPSHSANNSQNWLSLANSTTAITACGADNITVGTTLNANGVVYSVFIICGDSAGFNNGTFFPAFCKGAGPYVPPQIFNGITVLGNGGLLLGGLGAGSGLLKDVSGIYSLITGKRNDTLQDRQGGQTSVDVEIPDPTFKTGYIGG